jgi:DNA polymerase-1
MQQQNLQSKMILQVHDELVFDVHLSELELLKSEVTRLMKTAIELKVPMEVGLGTGSNWLDAH